MTVPYEQRILRRNGETWLAAGKPPAWAQHRLDMISANPWFTSIQGGVHLTVVGQNPNIIRDVLGMFVGGFAGERAYIDAEVIITSMNGSHKNTPTSINTLRRHEALVHTLSQDRLIGVIFGNGAVGNSTTVSNTRRVDSHQILPCTNLPASPGPSQQNCWVAGYFRPTFTWPMKLEGQPGTVWMVRLEKYDLENQSWWANNNHGLPPSNDQRNFSITTPLQSCPRCRVNSPRIYQEIFVCTNDKCVDVWRHNGKIIGEDVQLTYTNSWLQERRRPSTNPPIFPAGSSELIPDFHTWWHVHYNLPKINQVPLTKQNFVDRMGNLLRGFCCPRCNMFNSRVRWREWHCRNSDCRHRFDGAPPIVNIQQALTINVGRMNTDFTSHPMYVSSPNHPHFLVDEFVLGEDCKVAYLRPKPHTNATPGWSNDIFLDIQRLANDGTIPLERRWMKTPAGNALTSHFSVNYGANYHFTAATTTIPFEEADAIIRHAVDVTNDWIRPWRTPNDNPANEMYIAGYLTGQGMNWHDDGEKGLQDIITTYTLGCNGRFKLSIKPKYNAPPNPSAVHYDPVIPGCYKEAQRRALKQRLNAGQIDQNQWQTEFNNLMDKAKDNRRTLLDLPVAHGDIVVMYGSKTQSYLDHCAEVKTPMRFALTFRHITPEHATEEEIAAKVAKIAYDVEYHGQDSLDAVGDGDDGDQLPATSPRELDENGEPPRQRRRLNTQDTLAGLRESESESSRPPSPSAGRGNRNGRTTNNTTSARSGRGNISKTTGSKTPRNQSQTQTQTRAARRTRSQPQMQTQILTQTQTQPQNQDVEMTGMGSTTSNGLRRSARSRENNSGSGSGNGNGNGNGSG